MYNLPDESNHNLNFANNDSDLHISDLEFFTHIDSQMVDAKLYSEGSFYFLIDGLHLELYECCYLLVGLRVNVLVGAASVLFLWDLFCDLIHFRGSCEHFVRVNEWDFVNYWVYWLFLVDCQVESVCQDLIFH